VVNNSFSSAGPVSFGGPTFPVSHLHQDSKGRLYGASFAYAKGKSAGLLPVIFRITP
jgi:hypothetical protein